MRTLSILALAAILFWQPVLVSAAPFNNDHKVFRRVLQWAFPGRLSHLTEAWDGVENRQAYLDRAAKWSGAPVTAAEIEAQEAAYNTMLAGLPPRRSEAAAVADMNKKNMKAMRDALWELHRAIRGEITLPNESKGDYSGRLKDMRKVYE